MVKLLDLLQKHEIPKVIDPGSGSTINTTSSTNIPDSDNQTDVVSTPLQVVISDLIGSTQNVITTAQNVIKDITTINGSDNNYASLASMSSQAVWNPASLLGDPTSRPSTTINMSAINEAERDAYRTSTDPRVPYLYDLNLIIADAGSSQYLLQTVWNSVLGTNSIYSVDQGDNIVRLALAREQEHINSLQSTTNNINNLSNAFLTNAFIEALVNKLFSKVNLNSTSNTQTLNSITSLINTLQTLKGLLQISLITQTADWARVMSSIRNTYGNLLQRVAEQAMKQQSYVTATMIDNTITGFIGDIDNILGIDLESTAQLKEFRIQIDNVVFKQISKAEDDLIGRERHDYELQRSRNLALQNSQKSSLTKQYVQIIQSAITYLQSLRSTLNLSSSFVATQQAALISTLQQTANKYTSKPRLGQPPILQENISLINPSSTTSSSG